MITNETKLLERTNDLVDKNYRLPCGNSIFTKLDITAEFFRELLF